jgi:hypothetical protein
MDADIAISPLDRVVFYPSAASRFATFLTTQYMLDARP